MPAIMAAVAAVCMVIDPGLTYHALPFLAPFLAFWFIDLFKEEK